MKHRILKITLWLTLTLTCVQAKPRIHFGVCESTLFEVSGRCRPREECDTFENADLPTDTLDSLKCLRNDNKVLYCCPISGGISSVISSRFELIDIREGDNGTNVKEAELLLRPPECGRALTNRIFEGLETTIDEFPWMALLVHTSNSGEINHLCGGSLINAKWVVTAAHCVTTPGLSADQRVTGVRLGEWNTETNPDFEVDRFGNKDWALPHVDVPVKFIISHPDYNKLPRRFSNDIALLRLKDEVTFTNFVKPICLPLNQQLRSDLHVDATGKVSGWGHTEHNRSATIKRKASLKILPLADCQNKYRRHGFELDISQMCALGRAGIDTCRGDSGGPLIIETNNEHNKAYFFLAGVVSFGKKACGTPGFPGVYTRVGAYIDWIKSEITTYETNTSLR